MNVTEVARKALGTIRKALRDDTMSSFRKEVALYFKEMAEILNAPPEEAERIISQWEDVISTLHIARDLTKVRSNIKKAKALMKATVNLIIALAFRSF